ncbi:MAG: 3-deoxy-7-phosphoheptulonate synthase class II [Phycisphaeraceae bacterium]|nr:3-deoxy-7-phosphoheptulonate synthase class II [Phycisphaerales bacterium]MCB9842023.1 3-deoxy-7-phosphoheptulonate synthase class II [Phycisphaeraceae bacterium]
MTHSTPTDWSPDSWKRRLHAQQVLYADREAVDRAVAKLRGFPPLVTSFEVERLRSLIAHAQDGKRFLLQGGDCAETLADCTPEVVTNKLKILLQMSLVLVHGLKKPVIRVGRFAGQYAKPRSSHTETRGGVTLPSYFGDLVNGAEFTPEARTPDPHLMVRGYQHAAVTLNFIRSLIDSGFADLHHPEYWDLRFLDHASLPESLRAEYTRMSRQLADALEFMEALGDKTVDDLTRVEFFTSHEGLNLLYESAQTRTVPRRAGYYNLTTHLPWIGERTRALDGAHIEYFRGIQNPVGVKIGPRTTREDLLALIGTLNPDNTPGRVVLIHRMGAKAIREKLPALLGAVTDVGKKVLWVCDPMHANTISTSTGVKTRSFDDILEELTAAFDIHQREGTHMGGVHFELTGDDVTECIGGASGVTESDLSTNYASPCDPRLNYHQALEMAFVIARRAGRGASA